MSTTPDVVPALTLVRRIPAAAAAVFAAWVDPARVSEWQAPPPFVVRAATIEARVGGRYRVEVAGPDGDVHVTTGEFRVVEPGRRLVQTWWHEGPAGRDPAPSVVTVEFRAVGPALTDLVLTHAQLATPADRALTTAGWRGCLARLRRLFGDASPVVAATTTRAIAASPATIYAIWTTAAGLRAWGLSAAATAPVVGGRFRRETQGDDAGHVVTGEYLELAPGERIVMTWGGEPAPGATPALTLVTVDLAPTTAGTQVTVTEEPIAPADEAATVAAWERALGELARVAVSISR